MHYFLFDKSELAREKPMGAACIQAARVIVNDHRWQASSYKGAAGRRRTL